MPSSSLKRRRRRRRRRRRLAGGRGGPGRCRRAREPAPSAGLNRWVFQPPPHTPAGSPLLKTPLSIHVHIASFEERCAATDHPFAARPGPPAATAIPHGFSPARWRRLVLALISMAPRDGGIGCRLVHLTGRVDDSGLHRDPARRPTPRSLDSRTGGGQLWGRGTGGRKDSAGGSLLLLEQRLSSPRNAALKQRPFPCRTAGSRASRPNSRRRGGRPRPRPRPRRARWLRQ